MFFGDYSYYVRIKQLTLSFGK